MSDENLHKFARVNVQRKSGFDKGHKNLFTTKVGTLTPILCDELLPNSTVHLSSTINACLPPLASDCFMNCDLKVEAFFVPSRLCYGGFESWITGEKVGTGYTPQVTMRLSGKDIANSGGTGTLMDYLGFKTTKADLTSLGTTYSATTKDFNIYPFVAYHRIWNDWYRNSQVTQPIFYDDDTLLTSSGVRVLPFTRAASQSNPDGIKALLNVSGSSTANSIKFGDGTNLLSLRQRNFGIDYFTSATPQAQAGTASSVNIAVTGSSAGQMTISALRAANSLQMFLERNNLAGTRYVDWLHANYAANLSDGVAQRPLFLGSQTINVYSKGVNSTSSVIDPGTTNPLQNPFISVGSQYGQAQCSGSGSLIKNFTCDEHGYLMVLCSLVPKATYGSGCRRYLQKYNAAGSRTDMGNAILQNIGNQPIYTGELNALDSVVQPTSPFGYTDRFAEYMDMEDELHGLVRDGYSLESFALQRNFLNGQSSINTSFLEIPQNFLDQVSAVDGDISLYGCWVDSYLDYKVSQPLARYSVPSLQDPAAEHGETVTIRRGGSRID